MASSSGEEPRTSPVMADSTPMVRMEAKMFVATGHDHCQELKDMISKADPSTMVVVMASNNQTSAPKPRSPVMDPRLLAAACSGSWQKLQSFLNKQDRQTSSDGAIGSSAMQPASGDVEALRWESFLDGVTMDGDTFLHVMATNSDGDNLDEDGTIRKKAISLLFVQNSQGDTPLHYAARAAKINMVSFLIDLARGEDQDTSRVKALLEMENMSKWTALHEAVCSGKNDIVELLMKEDPELTSLPKTGTSPLYLAILMENKIIAKTLYELSLRKSGNNDRNLSYSGPDGQNALHAAVLRGKGLTEMVLGWNNNLTTQQDDKGSTPLHLVASVLPQSPLQLLASVLPQSGLQAIRFLLLNANPDALYQTDNDGSFPIHVAASVGATLAISDFIEESLSCVGLRDARGRTFLHVAVEKGEMWTVRSVCRNRSLLWILNMQDNKGNTAMHLAVQTGRLTMFYALFGKREVHLNSTNEKRETPLDIANRNISKGKLYYTQNSEVKICRALKYAGAKRGVCRQDCLEEDNIIQGKQDGTCKMDQVKEGTQNLCVGSVLIATITFGANFAMPGGYRADDHINGGTPTLARRYAFGAFVQANALAFASSMMATIALMSSGSPMHNPRSRAMNISMAFAFMDVSVTSLVAAFALGTYTMLAPVAHRTAVVVCVLSSLALLYRDLEIAIKNSVLAASHYRRKRICHGIVFSLAAFTFLASLIFQLWPIVVIYCLTALSHISGKVELAAQPPTPLA
ncbi:hypothetical protein CFC21_094791 [Triticum aestivum]|uniref:PGG domain-containing protein n=2 Tax=Triticum aestivum TaxID=4565 RepID=A0A9R1MWR4_WHEAT|nr:ankyrin repeat-containing protein At5g02620-like isoform X1 [Triticum aestivum]KAF7092291.1 hypothetical protein CFC21_094791 [Triticum aestivum]